uniref:Uncharacterized protein n=1 Tax=Romanomermis culicivorax TaxID=13658 RepID=A0A915KH49_ROMCU
MTRVVVCRGQSSSWLWCSSCHNLTMTGSWRLTMGFQWGPKQEEHAKSGFKIRLLRAEGRNKNKMVKE